ncbi:MAG: hypothetical protein KBG47_00720 [Bacteroidia bacterium]|nr:hypothetical protein [Bacteroidia bacterium]
MGSHHDHNDHSNEKKPVSFTVPLIFASAIVLVIVLLVSLGDPKHGECCCEKDKCTKECMDACKAGHCEKDASCEGKEHGDHHGDAHAADAKAPEHEAAADTTAASTAHIEATDTAATKVHKEEAHH